MAAGLARQGLLPVVNSFASFLASRANEQIYNQASEGTKVVYALHYAGLIPAGPGKSHQSVRDISLLGALPNVTIVQPANAEETRALLRWAVEDADENVAIRLAIGPSPRAHRAPTARLHARPRHRAARGRRTRLLLRVRAGDAARGARRSGGAGGTRRRLQVVSMPWLNRVDAEWLAELGRAVRGVFVLEDHAPGRRRSATRCAARSTAGPVTVFGVEGWPACGTPPEALRFSRARRRFARGPHRARRVPRAKPVSVVAARLARPPGSASRRGLFFDCGIVGAASQSSYGDAAASVFLLDTSEHGRLGVALQRHAACSSSVTWSPHRRARSKRLPPRRPLARRADRLLPARMRLNYRHGLQPRAHAARPQNWLLDSSRAGPLPRWDAARPRRCCAGTSHRAGTFRTRCSSGCERSGRRSSSATSRCTPPSRSSSAARRLGLPLVGLRRELGSHGRQGT